MPLVMAAQHTALTADVNNLAYTNANNNFSTDQDITGNLSVTGTGTFSDTVLANNDLEVRSTNASSTTLYLYPKSGVTTANATIRFMLSTGAASWEVATPSDTEPFSIYNYGTANSVFTINKNN